MKYKLKGGSTKSQLRHRGQLGASVRRGILILLLPQWWKTPDWRNSLRIDIVHYFSKVTHWLLDDDESPSVHHRGRIASAVWCSPFTYALSDFTELYSLPLIYTSILWPYTWRYLQNSFFTEGQHQSHFIYNWPFFSAGWIILQESLTLELQKIGLLGIFEITFSFRYI